VAADVLGARLAAAVAKEAGKRRRRTQFERPPHHVPGRTAPPAGG
jgi:hypothetical protein